MFTILLAKKEELSDAFAYIGQTSAGFVMICRENGQITGVITFDLQGGKGIIEGMKGNGDMHLPMVKAALNFLDLHGVREVVLADSQNGAIYDVCGFRDGKLSLDGYFTNPHTGC